MDLKRLSKRTLVMAMLVPMLSLSMSGKANAVETPVSNWDELKSNVVAGNSVIFDGNITTSGVDAIYSKNTVMNHTVFLTIRYFILKDQQKAQKLQ